MKIKKQLLNQEQLSTIQNSEKQADELYKKLIKVKPTKETNLHQLYNEIQQFYIKYQQGLLKYINMCEEKICKNKKIKNNVEENPIIHKIKDADIKTFLSMDIFNFEPDKGEITLTEITEELTDKILEANIRYYTQLREVLLFNINICQECIEEFQRLKEDLI